VVEVHAKVPTGPGQRKGRTHLKTGALSFALRAAGATGVAFQEFARWMSPWGWSRRDLSPVLRELREEGLTELTEDPDGEILALRLTQKGERELAAQTSR
jgi:hypothetical protein